MKKSYRVAISWLLEIINVCLMSVPFVYAWEYFYLPYVELDSLQLHFIILILSLGSYSIFGHIYEGFEVSIGKISDMIFSQVLAIMLADAAMYIVVGLLIRRVPDILPLIVALLAQLYIATVWSYVACRFYFSMFEAHKTIVVYDERRKLEELISSYGFDRKFDIQAVASADYFLAHFNEEFKDIDTIFLSGVSSVKKNELIKFCYIHRITIYLIPYIGDVLVSSGRPVHMFHLPVLQMSTIHSGFTYYVVKRAFDIISSACMLILISPVLIVTAIAIKLTDGGPVFYKQVRLTQDGREFKILKFRSMRVDAEKDGVARLSTGENDDRITPVGHIIRKFRIDELPQLFNILGGSMSVVGPRPERPQIAELYKKFLPEFDLRLQVKAGLTGYAQVYGKYNSTPYDKLQMDLMYIGSCNTFEDIRIIFATIKILFEPESTEGVAEGQTTAMGEPMENE